MQYLAVAAVGNGRESPAYPSVEGKFQVAAYGPIAVAVPAYPSVGGKFQVSSAGDFWHRKERE